MMSKHWIFISQILNKIKFQKILVKKKNKIRAILKQKVLIKVSLVKKLKDNKKNQRIIILNKKAITKVNLVLKLMFQIMKPKNMI